MSKKSKATMRELISDAKASPSQQKKSRIPPGIHDGVLTDRKGHTYTLSAQGITADDALRFAGDTPKSRTFIKLFAE